jgi:hypothetical protein
MTVSSDAPTLAEIEHPRTDPMHQRVAAPLVSTHRVLGFDLRVETNDPRVQAAADDSFGPRLGSAAAPLVLRLLLHGADEEPDWSPRQPLVRQQEHLALISASRATTVAIDVRAGFALGFISEAVAAETEFLRFAIVQSAAFTMMQTRSVVAVHSAGLVKDGRAVMLRGPSGAGKTTLTYAALRRGWSLLAEDVIFVGVACEPAPQRLLARDIRLHGLPWTLNLLPDATGLFPELAGASAFERLNGEHKIAINVEARFPGQTAAEAPLGPLVFVSRSGIGGPYLSRLNRDAALALLRDTAIMNEEAAARERGLWAAFLSLPAYALETGDDPDENAALLERVLDVEEPMP